MTPQEARELFSAAYDDELSERERHEFTALLAEHPEIQQEYEEFRTLLSGAPLMMNPEQPPDLMPGIRRKLRSRRGRRHGDRLGQLASPGRINPLLLSVVLLALLAGLWLLLSEYSLWAPPSQTPALDEPVKSPLEAE